MKNQKVNPDKMYAKLLTLSIIYEKEESCRREFLERILYNPEKMTPVVSAICDAEFRSWVETAIPVMQCREKNCEIN